MNDDYMCMHGIYYASLEPNPETPTNSIKFTNIITPHFYAVYTYITEFILLKSKLFPNILTRGWKLLFGVVVVVSYHNHKSLLTTQAMQKTRRRRDGKLQYNKKRYGNNKSH